MKPPFIMLFVLAIVTVLATVVAVFAQSRESSERSAFLLGLSKWVAMAARANGRSIASGGGIFHRSHQGDEFPVRLILERHWTGRSAGRKFFHIDDNDARVHRRDGKWSADAGFENNPVVEDLGMVPLPIADGLGSACRRKRSGRKPRAAPMPESIRGRKEFLLIARSRTSEAVGSHQAGRQLSQGGKSLRSSRCGG